MTQIDRLYDNQVFDHNGKSFRVRYETDQDSGAPWDECDGHGVISDWTTRSKRPGERVLSEDGRSRRYYDVTATLAIARRDGWGTGDGRKPKESARQYVARAVDADFTYCHGWANEYWHYLCVVVSLASDKQVSTSLCGVESHDDRYPSIVARELADELSAQIEQAESARIERARLALAADFGFGA